MAASKIQPNMGIWHLIAGIVIAVLGVYVWFNPAATLLGLALYLGIIFIVVGAGYFMLSFSNRSGWYLTVGILDMLVGVIFVGNLGLTAATLPIVLALWFLAIGVMQIVASFSLRREGYSVGLVAAGRRFGRAVCLPYSGLSGHRCRYHYRAGRRIFLHVWRY